MQGSILRPAPTRAQPLASPFIAKKKDQKAQTLERARKTNLL